MAKHPLQQFASGLYSPLSGFTYLCRRPALWRYAIWPILINLVITAIILAVLIFTGIWFFNSWYPWLTTSNDGSTSWWGIVLAVGLGLLLLVACIGITILLWKLLTDILCGFFYDLLARQVEIDLGSKKSDFQEVSVLHEILDALKVLFSLIVIQLFFLLIGFVPVVGPPLALIGVTYWTWKVLGLSCFEYPLYLRGLRLAERKQFVATNKAHTLGLGASIYLLQFIPFINAPLLTSGVVGAVLLHRRIEAAKS